MPEGGETRIAERRPLLLVPVPAESGWAAAPHAAAARASLAALQAGGAAGAAGVGKRAREDGAPVGQAEEDVSISMMVSDATGQTAADDGDSAASRARRAAGAPAAQQQEASSGGSGAAAAGADLPAGCCMAYVSAGVQELGMRVAIVMVLATAVAQAPCPLPALDCTTCLLLSNMRSCMMIRRSS